MFPPVFEGAKSSFKKLPGVGDKSAERYALSILEFSDEDLDEFLNKIKECKAKMGRCSICGHLTDKEECDICTNPDRKKNVICVVEDYKSVIMFERSQTFDGVYHVLNGLISPIDGVFPEDINIPSLLERLKETDDDGEAEVILALKPSIEGETTTLYIKKIFENKNIKVSRLSYGIPMGVDIDYLDSITLDRALLDRKEIS